MTEQNKTPLTAQPGSAPAPEQKPAEKRPAEKPLRRVGSLTLGACLIAAGVFFLLYFFVPGFDVQLTLKIAPAVALVLLGCEVLFFAARPGRWKYDFVSVLVCLVLMAGLLLHGDAAHAVGRVERRKPADDEPSERTGH